MCVKNIYVNCQDCMIYEKYLRKILKSEAKMSKCLQNFFCNNLISELKCVEPIEKRVALARSIICAYADKEKAMARLIKSLKLPPARYYPIRYCPVRCYKTQCCKTMRNKSKRF
jgi:hypothetical protein